MKILYSYGNISEELVQSELDDLKNGGYDVTPVNHSKLLGLKRSLFPEEVESDLDKRIELYGKIRDLAESHDILIVTDNAYSKEFLASLCIYKVFFCGDDPDGSKVKSKPYVDSFDYAFTGAVNYDDNTTMVEKYYEWGAKKADFWPIGAYSCSYKESNVQRDTDLIFIGNPQNKTKRLLDIYKAFPQMKVFGKTFGFKGLLRTYYHILTRKKGWYEGLSLFDFKLIKLFLNAKKVSNEEVISLYSRAKIGINIHMSNGPINYRLYTLPANGVMQICDCKKGLGTVFELGKEVIGYEKTYQAIEKIKYYLEQDIERRSIAQAGFRRVMKDYKRIDTWKVALNKIEKEMNK